MLQDASASDVARAQFALQRRRIRFGPEMIPPQPTTPFVLSHSSAIKLNAAMRNASSLMEREGVTQGTPGVTLLPCGAGEKQGHPCGASSLRSRGSQEHP